MLRVRLSVTLFDKYQTCELTEKEAVYLLESLKKAPDHKGIGRPFVCITGYNGMAIHILEGSFEDFPGYMILKQGIASHGNDKNICWPVVNKRLETEQIAYFTNHCLDAAETVPLQKHIYQPVTIHTQNLITACSMSNSCADPPPDLLPAPVFEPELWNNDIRILANNNCYTYALNIKGFRNSCGKDPNKTAFGNIINNCLADGLHIVPTVTHIKDKHLIALFAATPWSETRKNKTDYHFFRRDAGGGWSHKNGAANVTNRDFSGHIIKNVMTCNRGRYRYLYGLFQVTPSAIEKVTKRM